MKAQMLKLAGVKTEAAFYKKYPTQEAFMKVHGKALKKAQVGVNFGKPSIDDQDIEMPGHINNPNASSAKSQAYQQNQLFGAIGDTAPGLGKASDFFGKASGMLDKVGGYAKLATGAFGAAKAFGAEQDKVKSLDQENQLVDLQRTAKNSKDVDFGKMNQQLMWRPEQGLTSGNQVNGSRETGTNILSAKNGRVLQNGGGLESDASALKEMYQLDQITDYQPDSNDMTDEEAASFLKMYNEDKLPIVKELPSNFDAKSARDTWEYRTGLPWSEAKKLGYTTGSAKDNIKLLSELNDPRFNKDNIRSSAPKSSAKSRTPIEHTETPTGKLTPIDKPLQSFSEATKGKLKGKASRSNIHTPDEGTMFTRVGEYLANPFQTIGHYSKYGEAPAEGFSKHDKNAYDQSLGLANPAYWANAAANAVDYASEKEYKRAALEALDALPAASKLKYTKYLPYLEGLPAGRTYSKAAKQLGEGAKRLSGPASKQLGRGVAKQLKQPFTPNFVMYENGGEIQNTYAPNDLYDDLGYEPVKAANGFNDFMGSGGSDMINKLAGGAFNNNAGYQAGEALGNIGDAIIPGSGKILAPVLGTALGAVDQAFGPAGKIKKSQSSLDRKNLGMGIESQAQGFQAQHNSVMKEGGYVSNDWTPQVITKFGDHSAKDFYDFSHEGMDALRAGGQIRGEYTPVSERGLQTYALGGEVETTWGGEVEPIAHNPYLPKSGQIVEFKGNSHTESDGNGHTGIGVKYQDGGHDSYTSYAEFGSRTAEAQVEVQGGEPGYIDDKGNFNVGGALPLSLKMAKQIGTPELIKLAEKYDGMKVQNIIKDNAAKTVKVGKKINKVSDELDSFNPISSFDLIKQKSLGLMQDGFDKQLQNLAGDVNTITNFQTSINDTAKDISHKLGYNISADHLAKYGKIKKDTDPVTKDSVAEKGKKIKKSSKFAKPLQNFDVENPTHINNPLYNKKAVEEYNAQLPYDIIGDSEDEEIQPIAKSILAEDANTKSKKDNPWVDTFNNMLPYFRPSNAKALDQRQIIGELNALASNQLQPVQAQKYNPQLTTPYTISLQDQINEITAQTRAAQKMAQGNQAAQAAIAAQAYEAINKVKGEEFRFNQEKADKVYSGNIDTLNDAQFKNLAIASKQAQDQATALSNTKAIEQAALQSIGDKYLQNDAANQKLKIAENTYNYRYDDNGRLINMNPLQRFAPSGTESKTGGKGLAPGYEFTYDSDQNIIGTRKSAKEDVAKNGTKVKGKNSSIVKAMKNL